MSQSQQVFSASSEAATTEHEPSEILDALDDPDCRHILEATSDESLTASELSETCDLPLSTTYRKVERLSDSGLLRETIRLHRTGKHVNEYSRNVEDIVISVQDSGALELSVTHTVEPTRNTFPPRLNNR